MVGGGEKERKQVMGSAGINWELRKRNLFSMHEADITVIFFYYTLANETEGGLFDVRVWVTW